MSPPPEDFEKSISHDMRKLFVDALRSREDLSLAYVVRVVRGPLGALLRHITIGELILGDQPPSSPPPSLPPPPSPSAEVPASVPTRTGAARVAFDEIVHAQLATWRGCAPVGAGAIRAAVGGSQQQVARALARLTRRGLVRREGNTKATTYRVT